MRKLIILIFVGILLSTNMFGQNAKDYFDEAIILQSAGSYVLSLKAINKSIELDSNNDVFYVQKASLLFNLKRYKEALDFFDKSLKIFPKSRMLISEKGVFLSKMGQPELAIKNFKEAMKYAKTDIIRNYLKVNIAISKLNLRRFEEAYKELYELYLIDTTNLLVLLNLGNVVDDLGSSDEAILYYKKVILLEPGGEGPYINIGFILQKQEKYKESILYFNKALELDKLNPLIYSNLSFSKLKLGDIDGALKDINFSIKLYPVNSYAFRTRGLIYLEKENYKEACNNFQEALSKGYSKLYGDEVSKLKLKFCN